MTDINNVTIVGRLTRDCGQQEFQYLQSGTAVARISIAVNRSKKQGDQWVDEASFFDVVIFGKTAENLLPYLQKGKQIVVKGYLKQDRWQDKQTGENRSRVSVVADEVQLIGGQSQNGNGQGYQQAQNYQQQQFAQPQYPQNQQQAFNGNMPNNAVTGNPYQSAPQFNQKEQNGMNQAFGGNSNSFKEDLPWENTDIPF